MRIGFDISQTGTHKAGCGYFAHALIEAMLKIAPEHEYLLHPSFGDFYFDARMPMVNPYPGRNVRYGPRHFTRESARQFWAASDVESASGSPDIIHSNNYWCPVQALSGRLIYTLYDLSFAENPDWTTEANRTGCFDGVFRSAVAADWVVAISESSKQHYLRVFPRFPENRIRVIYPNSRFTDVGSEGKRPGALAINVERNRFWLNVGTIEPRKNQRLLVEAYARLLHAGGTPMPLVLAGGKGWLMNDFQEYVRKLGVSDLVLMIGYVSDEELIWLYRNCYANLYPSLFEGFGLPVLEGMQFGAPTIASNSTSIPEVAGDAAMLLDPHDPEGWAKAMLALDANIEDRDKRSAAGIEQASRFRWEQSANSLLELYAEAMASPKRVTEG